MKQRRREAPRRPSRKRRRRKGPRRPSRFLSDRAAVVLNALDPPSESGTTGGFVYDEIASLYGIPIPSLYVTLGRLVKRGLAERVPRPDGGLRRRGYRITP